MKPEKRQEIKAGESVVVLLSGGLDSTVNLYEARSHMRVALALTFDYGQRAAAREIASARELCALMDVPHKVVSLPWFREFTSTSLVNTETQVPVGESVAIDSLQTSEQTAKSVWVPNRNGIFLNIAAGFAEGLGASYVIPGFNAEEAATFSDNTGEFLEALTNSFSFSTANQVKTHCFTTHLSKTEIVARGQELEVDWNLIWPCYFGGEKPCGECESCQRARRALKGVYEI